MFREDYVVARILAEDFAVRQPPEARVCRECDFRVHCTEKRTIRQTGVKADDDYGKQTPYALSSQEM